MRTLRWIWLLLLAAEACGGGSPSGGEEAQQVLSDLRSVRAGEFLIRASTSPQSFGPFEFKAPAYVLQFEHGDGSGGPHDLVVSIGREEDEGDSARVVVDTSEGAGRKRVVLQGPLYIHVLDAGSPYVIRFTPAA
jgi:hypothetical protein